jgi:DNA-binding transcriptional MerR regulator
MLCSHDRQSTPSSAPEVNTQGGLLTIGELARRAGVTASALRYYEELGLLPPPARISGQRRYPESAARLVAAILLYSDAGFTLAEQKVLLATRASTPATACAAPAKTSRNAPTSTPASPPGWPASHCHNPTGSCTANGPGLGAAERRRG